MILFKKAIDLRSWIDNQHLATVEIGFVPTMGALHLGHASLIKRCAQENDICILSIFVNPTQFNSSEDINKYPQSWDQDLILAKTNGANFIRSTL